MNRVSQPPTANFSIEVTIRIVTQTVKSRQVKRQMLLPMGFLFRFLI